MLIARADGTIYDHPEFALAGRSGFDVVPVSDRDLMPLPRGSTLFTIPDARPLGWQNNKVRWVSEMDGEAVSAVAAFLPSGYTRTLLPATLYEVPPAEYLPLWSYTAVGMAENGAFVAAAVPSDPLRTRFDPCDYDDTPLPGIVRERLGQSPDNRLLRHLGRCAMEYHCFAAKNLFFGRWEAPLPTAPGCNARCIGCISLQPPDGCAASHERIPFVPTPDEIADTAVGHLESAEDAIVSFGQGCEGEPLTQADAIEEGIRAIRSATDRGTIHLNTNGYAPERIRHMARAGLDSIRISMSSTIRPLYEAYHNPVGYEFNQVTESVRTAVDAGLFTSINLFVFPGVTDREAELESLVSLIGDSGLNMIQARNMNIDPELYLKHVPIPGGEALGVRTFLKTLRREFPSLEIGYYNRPKRLFTERLCEQLPW